MTITSSAYFTTRGNTSKSRERGTVSDACCAGDACAPHAPEPAASRLTASTAGAGAAIVLGAGLNWLGYSNWALLPYALAIALTIPGPARRAWQSVRRRVLDIHVL